ncbi:Sepiapterin reductase [Plasmodiophora brassicae]|uniref:Ketoreductase domain-containing protein n=1 Tax=Plasmodiophora brassicae TaxID=37360 RepID=A0A0G4IIL5_PLABS|nr:hypothetical protein PBRA_003753 [Plasmodiophora brassicae]SPQ94270.1 unnamed protein product [Plasmodiophora brassicae]
MAAEPTKWAVVTGAGSGIGRALCIDLCTKRSVNVIGIGRRPEPIQETVRLCGARESATMIGVVGDITSSEDRDRLAKQIPEDGIVMYLVHNAGTAEPFGTLADASEQGLSHVMNTNCVAPILLTSKLLPKMARGSRILHVSSGAAHRAQAGLGAYCVSKAALHMAYLCLRDELAPMGIAVGSARPGCADTPMMASILDTSEETLPRVVDFRRMRDEGRLFQGDSVAGFLCALLCDTNDKEFSRKEYDIRDEHRPWWTQGK